MVKDDIKTIIDWTLKYLNMHSDDASALVYRTGMAETKYNHLKQMGDGPALGFFQCEPNTMKDIMENYVSYRDGLKQKIYYLGYNDDNPEMSLMSNVALQVAFCRINIEETDYLFPIKIKLRNKQNTGREYIIQGLEKELLNIFYLIINIRSNRWQVQ